MEVDRAREERTIHCMSKPSWMESVERPVIRRAMIPLRIVSCRACIA